MNIYFIKQSNWIFYSQFYHCKYRLDRKFTIVVAGKVIILMPSLNKQNKIVMQIKLLT